MLGNLYFIVQVDISGLQLGIFYQPALYPDFQYHHKFHGTRGRTRTGTAVKPEDFKSSMSTIPSRGR